MVELLTKINLNDSIRTSNVKIHSKIIIKWKAEQEIRKLWEIFKTTEPPHPPENADEFQNNAGGFSLENGEFDSILKKIFFEADDFKEVYKYYLSFLNKNSKKYVLTSGDDGFYKYLNSNGIKSKYEKEDKISSELQTIGEKYAAIILVNTDRYLNNANLFNFTKNIYENLENGGVFLIELADATISNKVLTTPEAMERICKDCDFMEIRTYKTPLTSEGLQNYFVICRKP